MSQHELIEKLLWLSHEVGRPERELAILGEGNTSCDAGDGSFWIKASGGSLATLDAAAVSQVYFDRVLDLVNTRTSMTQEEVVAAWPDLQVDPKQRRPSVETFMHALCLTEGGARWVAHTHPISCNSLLCSKLGAEPFQRHIFPDGIVVCGRYVGVVPYVDPGFALAHAIRNELRRYQDRHGKSPKLLLMLNHGIVSLGQNVQEALNIQLMADKWARALIGAYAVGGPQFMPEEEAARIDTRLDEEYRRKQLLAAKM